MSGPDPLARFLLEKAEQVEAERQRKKWLHEMAVEEAMNELIAYAKLIREAKAFLDECAIEAHLLILKKLRAQVDSDPHYVAREARIYRKVLRKELEEAKEEERRKRHEEWLKKMETTATIMFLMRAFQLRNVLDGISQHFHELRMTCMRKPEVERAICNLLKAKSLDEVEERVKKIYVEAFRGQLRRDLKDNPYSWCAEFLTA